MTSATSPSASAFMAKRTSLPLQPLVENGQVDRSSRGWTRGNKDSENISKSRCVPQSKSSQGPSSSPAVSVSRKTESIPKVDGASASMPLVGLDPSSVPPAVAPHVTNGPGLYEIGEIRYPNDGVSEKDRGKETGCALLLDRGVKDRLTIPTPPIRPRHYGDRCYVASTKDGKGKGLFTRREIPQGGILLVERPVIVAVAGGTGNGNGAGAELGLDPPAELYKKLLVGLREEVRNEVLALSDSQVAKGGGSLESILKTHAFTLPLGVPNMKSRSHRVLFLKASRCNHSCGPNAMWNWDLNSFTLTLQAVRPIHSSEEVTVPYIDCIAERHERRTKLKALYNFDCRCIYCDLHWGDIGLGFQSDRARRELREFFKRTPSFEEWCSDPRAKDHALIDAHLRALDLREREGVQGVGCMKHVDAIVMCFGALGDVERFRRWVSVARKAKAVEGNLNHVRVLEKWIEDPRSFPVWGWRRN